MDGMTLCIELDRLTSFSAALIIPGRGICCPAILTYRFTTRSWPAFVRLV